MKKKKKKKKNKKKNIYELICQCVLSDL
jgi:hypothetical protein